jgi:hypothetical protein
MSTLKSQLLTRFPLTHSKEMVDGEKVFVKTLSNAQMESYQFKRIDHKTGTVDFSKVEGAQDELVALCLCEDDGSLMFKNGKEVGTTMPPEFVKAAYVVCSEHNGMAQDVEEEAGKD